MASVHVVLLSDGSFAKKVGMKGQRRFQMSGRTGKCGNIFHCVYTRHYVVTRSITSPDVHACIKAFDSG